MRVTSSLWVGAHVRKCHAGGAIATVARRGAEEAGAIFVIVEWLDGSADLYAPAPQSAFADAQPDDRLFERVIMRQKLEVVSAKLEREARFDPDIWVVAVEDRDGRPFLDTTG